MLKSVMLMFPCRSFLVSGLTLRSLLHFEFIFVYDVRECSNFILLHGAVQFSQHDLLKKVSFLHCASLPPLSQCCWIRISRLWLSSCLLAMWHSQLLLSLPCSYWGFRMQMMTLLKSTVQTWKRRSQKRTTPRWGSASSRLARAPRRRSLSPVYLGWGCELLG